MNAKLIEPLGWVEFWEFVQLRYALPYYNHIYKETQPSYYKTYFQHDLLVKVWDEVEDDYEIRLGGKAEPYLAACRAKVLNLSISELMETFSLAKAGDSIQIEYVILAFFSEDGYPFQFEDARGILDFAGLTDKSGITQRGREFLHHVICSEINVSLFNALFDDSCGPPLSESLPISEEDYRVCEQLLPFVPKEYLGIILSGVDHHIAKKILFVKYSVEKYQEQCIQKRKHNIISR